MKSWATSQILRVLFGWGIQSTQGWAPGAILEFAFFISRGWYGPFKRPSVATVEYLYKRGLGNESSARRGQEMDLSGRSFFFF